MSENDLSDKEKIDALLKIHERHRDRFEKRRSHEWKIWLSLWSVLAIMIAGTLTKKVELTIGWWWGLAACIVIVWIVCAFHGRHYMMRHQSDVALGRYWLELASVHLLRSNSLKDEKCVLEGPPDATKSNKAGLEGRLERARLIYINELLKSEKLLTPSWCKNWAWWFQLIVTICLGAILLVVAFPNTNAGTVHQRYEVKYSTSRPSSHIVTEITNKNQDIRVTGER